MKHLLLQVFCEPAEDEANTVNITARSLKLHDSNLLLAGCVLASEVRNVFPAVNYVSVTIDDQDEADPVKVLAMAHPDLGTIVPMTDDSYIPVATYTMVNRVQPPDDAEKV